MARRFYSCVLDETHLIAAVRYVERNPVRASMIKEPWEWKWSSASAHIDMNGTDSFLKLCDMFQFIDIPREKWKDFINIEDNLTEVVNIRKHTISGKPLKGYTFLKGKKSNKNQK